MPLRSPQSDARLDRRRGRGWSPLFERGLCPGEDAPQVTEKARLVLPDNVQWQSCSPEGAKPEEKCQYFIVAGDEKKGASAQYVRPPKRCALAKHWETSPMHLVGLEGEFIYQFEGGPEMFLTPGAYIYVPENKVHSERCGDEGALFFLYLEKPFGMHMVKEQK